MVSALRGCALEWGIVLGDLFILPDSSGMAG